MKYIRTKDGKIIKILKEGIDKFGKYGMIDEENCIRNYDDLKQSDTIEELCDGFVIVPKDKNIKPYFTATLAVFDDVKSLLDIDDVYDAIWTNGEHNEPILKSVAKMKDVLLNGEIDWELL